MERIPLRMGILNLLHEILHAFGASHDPKGVLPFTLLLPLLLLMFTRLYSFKLGFSELSKHDFCFQFQNEKNLRCFFISLS